MSENYLVIPDLQIPFEAKKALSFCQYLKRHYKIKNENVYCCGDESDFFYGSTYAKDPDSMHSPTTELQELIDKLKQWYSVFPKLKLATSNHAVRYWKRASEAGIPSQVIRHYRDVIQAPKGWIWQDKWKVDDKHPFLIKHGMEYSGVTAFRTAPTIEGMSVAFGHLHSSAGIAYVKSDGLKAWGFNTGCLINPDAIAFQYGKWSRWKPNLGCGVIAERGLMPIWIPLE